MAEVSELLERINTGDESAFGQLVTVLYDELRDVARRMMRAERQGHLLQTTALVHEAFLRLVEVNQVRWETRSHFFGAAAVTMRRILVEQARKRLAAKRGRGVVHDELDDSLTVAFEPDLDVIALDAAVEELRKLDAERARVVELRYFAGLSIDETAEVLGVSPSAVNRDWSFVKAWLYRRLSGGNGG